MTPLTSTIPTLESLSNSDTAQFVDALGDIFEHSPWVAAVAWESRPFTSTESLHGAMVRAMRASGCDRQLALIRAHPQLAGHQALVGSLTASSKAEQERAGLKQCSAAELEELRELNARYLAKFGFPFVMAVANRTRNEIFVALRERSKNTHEMEFVRSLNEIAKIAELRLVTLLAMSE